MHKIVLIMLVYFFCMLFLFVYSINRGGATPGPAGARAPAEKAVPRLVPRLEKARVRVS